MKKNSRALIIAVIAFFIVSGTCLYSASVGQKMGGIKLIDKNDNPKWIPYMGSKVLTIFYSDPDEKDVNDPVSNAIKAKNYNKSKYLGIGIANAKDTWIPNAAIRMAARKKEKQFKGSVILIDENKSVSKKWGLGNCDDLGVILIIGKDKKLKYVKKIKTKAQSRAVVAEVLRIIEAEMAK